MINVEHTTTLAASIDDVWAELSQYDRVLNWIPYGRESTIEITGEGIGMIRDLHLADLGYVQHRLDIMDHDKKEIGYTLTGGLPLGMKNYSMVASLSPLDGEKCVISWRGRMEGDGSQDEAEIAAGLLNAVVKMTEGLEAASKGAPSPHYPA